MEVPMSHQPLVERREAQPYAAIPCAADDEPSFRAAVDQAFPQLFRSLGERAIEPTGPPFIRYLVVDEDGQPRQFEVAVPIAEPAPGGGRVTSGELPAGNYVTLLHVGPYTHELEADLGDARAALLAWAAREGIALDCRRRDGGTAFAGCVERYLTDARAEPDWSQWRTELAYLAA
jgi:GyrI-like small molecule binding domain